MQCILGLEGSFPRVERDKTAAWWVKERMEGRERERECEGFRVRVSSRGSDREIEKEGKNTNSHS